MVKSASGASQGAKRRREESPKGDSKHPFAKVRSGRKSGGAEHVISASGRKVAKGPGMYRILRQDKAAAVAAAKAAAEGSGKVLSRKGKTGVPAIRTTRLWTRIKMAHATTVAVDSAPDNLIISDVEKEANEVFYHDYSTLQNSESIVYARVLRQQGSVLTDGGSCLPKAKEHLEGKDRHHGARAKTKSAHDKNVQLLEHFGLQPDVIYKAEFEYAGLGFPTAQVATDSTLGGCLKDTAPPAEAKFKEYLDLPMGVRVDDILSKESAVGGQPSSMEVDK